MVIHEQDAGSHSLSMASAPGGVGGPGVGIPTWGWPCRGRVSNHVDVVNSIRLRSGAVMLSLLSATGVSLASSAHAAWVSNPTVVGTIPVDSGPLELAVSPDGTRVYVTNSTISRLSVIDTVTNTRLTTIPVGGGPEQVAVSPNGSRAYVTNRISNSVSVIDTATNTVLTSVSLSFGAAPKGVAVNPISPRVYVANSGADTVSVIDSGTNTVVATISGFQVPTGIAASPDGSRVYVTNDGRGDVSVINTATNSIVGTITVGLKPQGVAFNPSGSRAYVANYLANSISVIDTSAGVVTATITGVSNPQAVASSPDGSRAYVTARFSNAVVVIDTATNAVVTSVGVGSLPIGIAVSPDGTRAYSANSGANAISVIDTGWQPPSAPGSAAPPTTFRYVLPDGSECSAISPQVVSVGAMVTLPGVDADCRTMPGSIVAGWTIPTPPGSTEYGSPVNPFVPQQPVRVVESQSFTLVSREPVLTFHYSANVAMADACAPASAPHASTDGRTRAVWVPRADVPIARFPERASCTPPGHVLSGWVLGGDAGGTVFAPGSSLPRAWADSPTNARMLGAVWRAAR